MIGLQCKLARVALDWGVRELAAAADVSTHTVVRLEKGEPLREATYSRVKEALEDAGIEFITDDGNGVGVRLRNSNALASGQDRSIDDSRVYSVDKNSTKPEAASMTIRKVFAKNLREHRTARAISQEELASRSDVHRTYISALERCVYSPTIDMVEKLAHILGIRAADLLNEDADR